MGIYKEAMRMVDIVKSSICTVKSSVMPWGF